MMNIFRILRHISFILKRWPFEGSIRCNIALEIWGTQTIKKNSHFSDHYEETTTTTTTTATFFFKKKTPQSQTS